MGDKMECQPKVLKKLSDREDATWIFRILNQLNQLTQGAALLGVDRAEFEAAHIGGHQFRNRLNRPRKSLQSHGNEMPVGI